MVGSGKLAKQPSQAEIVFGDLLAGGPLRVMKTVLVINTLLMLALAIGPIGCKRHTPLPPGTVVFEGTGVALVPGEHWKEVRSGPAVEEHDICLPVLQGEGELNGVMIQVYSSPADHSPPERRAASVRKQAELRPDVIKESFQQEKFTTDSGLAGVHVSYDIDVEVKGRKMKGRNHVYIVQNARHSTVGVSVSAVASRDLEPVHEMIRKTLRLE